MRRIEVALVVGMSVLVGCTDDPEAEERGTETEGTGGSQTGDVSMTAADESSTGGEVEETDEGLDDTTGGVEGNALIPCDPRDDEPCDVGECAGSTFSGFYCRPGCSDSAEPGTTCGSDDVCLPVTGNPGDDLACFDVGECDVLDSSGCNLDAGETCVVASIEPFFTECVPSGGGGVGSACGPAGMHACDVGLGCFGADLDDDDSGTCQPWCVPDEPLPDGCNSCIPLGEGVGTCADCSVVAQDCPDEETCTPINEFLGGVCVPWGPGGAGESCGFGPDEGCAEGLLCLPLEDAGGAVCVEMCQPGEGAACSIAGEQCIDLGVIVPGAPQGELGLCIPTEQQFCDPSEEVTGCDPREVCFAVAEDFGICGPACDPTEGDASCEGNFACIPSDEDGAFNVDPFIEGNGACGIGCANDGECGGDTCLLTDGLDVDGICGTTCTPGEAGCAPEMTCVPTPGDPGVGACIPIGDPCDPALQGECAGAGGTCIVLDGEVDGVCMPQCFVQDPGACMGMPASCQVRSDADYHAGVCLGGGDVCDPVLQDCEAEQACRVTAGGPIGGISFTCDEGGGTPAGGGCADDDEACGPGLFCFEEVCTTYCDPAADDCPGSCQDFSAQIYQPPGTLGACVD